LDRLKAAATELCSWLQGFEGVVDLSDDLRPGKREYRLHLKPSAGVLGLDAKAVSDQVRGAFQGIEVDEFPVGPESLVPLSVVSDLEEVRGWARIHRVNGRHAVSIRGDLDPNLANARELLALAALDFIPGLLERYPDLSFEMEGQGKEGAKTSRSIGRNVLLGLISVYMLLALQFRGYLAPIAVMLVIPTALIGVVFGHLILGLDLTLPSIVGMASLFGVVVNDSILLVYFIREVSARGIPIA